MPEWDAEVRRGRVSRPGLRAGRPRPYEVDLEVLYG